jgi:hypothetical protein
MRDDVRSRDINEEECVYRGVRRHPLTPFLAAQAVTERQAMGLKSVVGGVRSGVGRGEMTQC